jgi:hypothetical protein
MKHRKSIYAFIVINLQKNVQLKFFVVMSAEDCIWRKNMGVIENMRQRNLKKVAHALQRRINALPESQKKYVEKVIQETEKQSLNSSDTSKDNDEK